MNIPSSAAIAILLVTVGFALPGWAGCGDDTSSIATADGRCIDLSKLPEQAARQERELDKWRQDNPIVVEHLATTPAATREYAYVQGSVRNQSRSVVYVAALTLEFSRVSQGRSRVVGPTTIGIYKTLQPGQISSFQYIVKQTQDPLDGATGRVLKVEFEKR